MECPKCLHCEVKTTTESNHAYAICKELKLLMINVRFDCKSFKPIKKGEEA